MQHALLLPARQAAERKKCHLSMKYLRCVIIIIIIIIQACLPEKVFFLFFERSIVFAIALKTKVVH